MAELDRLIAMPDAPVDVLVEARLARGSLKTQMGDPLGEVEDCIAVINMSGLKQRQCAYAFRRLSEARRLARETQAAVDRPTTAVRPSLHADGALEMADATRGDPAEAECVAASAAG